MKETDTMQSYKYLQAIFGDKWVDWGVSVGFLLLIASWFVPRNTADFLVHRYGTYAGCGDPDRLCDRPCPPG